MNHFYSIDLESWTHSQSIINKFPLSSVRKKMDNDGCKKQIYEILEILRRKKQRLTWFVVAEIYDWYPKAIEDIAYEGHEIAFHSYTHQTIQSAKVLTHEIAMSKNFLHKFRISGYRAPRMQIQVEAYEILKKNNFLYSSSTYSQYLPGLNQGIIELPVSAIKLNFFIPQIPFGSGSAIGLLGLKPILSFIKKYENLGRSANLFIHSWQIINEGKEATLSRLNDSLKNPLFLPYCRNIKKEFSEILSECKFEAINRLKL